MKGLTDAQAHELARNGKVIVHIDGGLHATEVAGAQHTIQLAYNLVTKTDPETNAILDNVILLLWFSINPDGQNQVANWYRSNLGTPYEVSNMPGLWQEYIGHDNNRDGYMNNMIESQVITRAELEYYPEVFYNHHQTAPFPARIWIPPFGDPVSLNPHPLMYRWVNVFGTSMAAYLDEHDMPGAMHRGRFDDWYPGFVDHVNNFRNTVSFLTETALYRYATPHFYTVDEFPREKQDLRAEVFYSSPWNGGWWRLRDAAQLHAGLVDGGARHGRQESRGTALRPLPGRPRRDRAVRDRSAVRVRDSAGAARSAHRCGAGGEADDRRNRGASGHARFHGERRNVQAGDWVVLMDQPFAALVKELFEPQKYPDLRPAAAGGWRRRSRRGGSGWRRSRRRWTRRSGGDSGGSGNTRCAGAIASPGTGQRRQQPEEGDAARAEADGVRPHRRPRIRWAVRLKLRTTSPGGRCRCRWASTTIMVVEPVSSETRAALKKIDHVAPILGKVEGSGPVFAFSHNSNASMKSVNDILNAGGTVSFSKSEATIYAGGSAASILKNNGVDARSMNDMPAAFAAKKIRVGLYEPWAGNIDEGWTQWILEQFHFPFTRDA